MHFETLWEDAEKSLQTETSISSFSELVKDAMSKLMVLDQLDVMVSKESSVLSNDEKMRLKSNTLGKLVLSLTQISAKEGINVYAALKAALDDRKISIFEAKYK